VLQQINAARMQGLTPDLNGANLSQLDLSGADLSDAGFREVNLSQANLNQASLRHANLSRANLSGANLSQANLNGGHLTGADLSGANLSSANLNGGNLVRANLGEANLTGADLRWANLSQANLGQADLSGANLEEAILKGTDLHNVRHNPQTKWPVLFTRPTPQQPLVKPTVDPRSEGISIVPSQEREVEPEPVSPGHILLPLSEPELPVSHSWLEAWVKALMRPSLKTFEELANDPKASSSRAFKWIFVSALIISLPTWILSGGSLLGAGIGAVLGAALFITIINVIALLLGGKGTYGQLTFTMAAFMVPLALISIVVQVIANLNSSLGFVVWLLFGLYWLVLAVIAVKAVHQFGWLKAVTTNSLIPVVITGLLVATVVFTQPAGAVGDDFMGALQNSNYAQAYSLCTPDLQSELDSSENLEVILSQVDVQIASWDWSARSPYRRE
jgi:hypothetical protein